MAGGLICSLPVYVWRLHDTEIEQNDYVDEEGVIHDTNIPKESRAGQLGEGLEYGGKRSE